MLKILIADDNETLRRALERALKQLNFETRSVDNGQEALDLAQKERFDLALLDIKMPLVNGMEVLKSLKTLSPLTRVILMTGYASIDTAVEALRQEAADYLIKPFTIQELEDRLVHLLDKFNLFHQKKITKTLTLTPLFLGKSEAIETIRRQVPHFAESIKPILIIGESGTGKKLLAHEIHQHSARKDQPFIAISCTSLPEHLLEVELLGQEKELPSGVISHKKGLLSSNSSGTILLDGIEAISKNLQNRLLEALSENKTIRVIATSNKTKPSLLKNGFNENLMQLFSKHEINLPPLRERMTDFSELTGYFLGRYSELLNKKASLSPQAKQALTSYTWPGNIRELENAIERAVILATGQKEIGIEEFPSRILNNPQ